MRADCTRANSPFLGARTVRTRTREYVWLWWKLDVTGRQSGPGGRTVRHSNSKCTREGVFSGWAFDLCCGRSAPGARTVRRLISNFLPETLLSLVDFKDERRTVRSWGTDGPPANFKIVPETMFVSGSVEHSLRTVRSWGADGPPRLNG